MLSVGKPHILNKDLFLKRVEDILESGFFTNNYQYTQFLEDFIKDYYHIPYAVAVNNATSALDISLAFLKQKYPFGQIIVPSFTFAASVHSIVRAGFEPIFADIDDNFCLDMESVDSRVNSKTVAIMPVNLFGNYNNPDNFKIYRDLFIINDSAQAINIFLENQDQYSGNFGDCEILSGHSTKLMGAFEAGILCTNNEEIAKFAIEHRNFGFKVDAGPQGELNSIGTNYKINEISAAGFLCQLECVEDIQDEYYQNFQQYKQNLPDWIKLSEPNVYFSNYSYVVTRVHPAIRDDLVNFLYAKGVHARTYFQPIHLSKPYREKYGHHILENTERIADQVVVLPTGLCIATEDVVKIISIIQEFVN